MKALPLLICITSTTFCTFETLGAGAPHLNGDSFCVTVAHKKDRVTITNECGKPVEMQYCFDPDPRFDSGDINKTCATEGVRTTGRLESGVTLEVMQRVTRPFARSGGIESGLWMNLCDATKKNLKCEITSENPVFPFNPFSVGENYKYVLLSVAKSKKLEQNDAGVVRQGSETLNGPDSSMCQGDTNDLAGYWPIGRFVAAEEAGMSGTKIYIEESAELISYYQKEADEFESIMNDMAAARRNRKIAEFLECHQANNWPAIHWLQNAWNACKKNSPNIDPDKCIENLARKYHRLGL